MCTVTFWPKRGGYVLGMNRDEQRARPAGLPPTRFLVGGRQVLHPQEPGGGTWVSVNDDGVSFALVNWYAIPARAPQPAVSRGAVVLALREATTPAEAAARLHRVPLERVNPFRLIGVFDRGRVLREWRWNWQRHEEITHPPEPQQWISSGYDEPEARRQRGVEFARRRQERGAGGALWLRALHASHAPARGPFSTCMHRDDAVTVSYTEITVSPGGAAMAHIAGTPCLAATEPAAAAMARSAPGSTCQRRARLPCCGNGLPELQMT